MSGAFAGAQLRAPPVPESPFLTTGAGGAGGGFLRLDTICTGAAQPLPCTTFAGDQEDVAVSGVVTDVQCAGPITPPYAPFV